MFLRRFIPNRSFMSTLLCSAIMLYPSVIYAATSGIDTANSNTLPFSINGNQYMILNADPTQGALGLTIQVGGLTVANALSTTLGALSAGVTTLGSTTLGTPKVAANLTVNGTISGTAISGTGLSITNNTTFNSISTAGGIQSYAFYHNSDMRLKTDIRPISGALDKVLSLKGVQFNWKQDGRADMGVVAQNVAQIFPDIVSKGPDGMMAVEYDSLIGPMIEAMRELKSENDDLRQKMVQLEASQSNNKLQAENDQLRHQLAEVEVMKTQLKQIRQTLEHVSSHNGDIQTSKINASLPAIPDFTDRHISIIAP